MELNATEIWAEIWPSEEVVLQDPEAPFRKYFDPLLMFHEYMMPQRPMTREEVETYSHLPAFISQHADFFNSLPLTTPAEFVDASYCMIYAIAMLTVLFLIAHFVFNTVWTGFKTVYPEHKKWYIVANISKAFFLFISCSSRLWWWYGHKGMWENVWHLHPLQACYTKRTGVVYVMTDIVALFMVPKLPHNTIVHHWTTLALCMWTWGSDETTSVVFRMINVYGFFSTIACVVNFYLALRVIYPERGWFTEIIRILSFWVYLIVCILNWVWHTCWFVNLFLEGIYSIVACVYFLSLALVVQDDIKLMKWLWDPPPPRVKGKKTN
eukprot:Rmarinus@m.14230